VLLNGVSGAEGNDLIAANVGTVATGSLAPLNLNSPTLQDGASEFGNDFISGQVFGGEFEDNSPTGILSAVASNTAFDIQGQLFTPVATGDFLINFTLENIAFDMGVTVSGDDDIIFGTAAQDPTDGGTGLLPTITTLAPFGGGAGQIQVYDGGRRTASAPGSIAEQSVRFDLNYALDGDTSVEGIQPFDLSFGNGTITMFMVYTVFANSTKVISEDKWGTTMNILVLGGYGLIGLEICRDLLRAGHHVTGLGRRTSIGERRLPAVNA